MFNAYYLLPEKKQPLLSDFPSTNQPLKPQQFYLRSQVQNVVKQLLDEVGPVDGDRCFQKLGVSPKWMGL